jgi:two-component system response regulator AtoC
VMIRGLSPEWEKVEKRVERAADTNAIVILRGESGTGKELVARSIHFNSRRRDGKLVVVNSAAIPDTLLESALFGHVKGAYTGATYDRVGEFEKAHQGTIFLDEIGDLSLPLQAKLLRVLETGEIQKLGSNEEARRVDVRVIAATSRNLEEMMENREFREDLYFRLHVVPIWLPPLRVYKKSIPGMVKAFVREAAMSYQRPVEGMSAEALDLLMRHEYRGNVRELKNIIEQSVIMAAGKTITVDDLPRRLTSRLKKQAPAQDARDFKSMKKQVLENFEREYLQEVLTEAKGNISKASDISGINRVNFYKLLRRHELDPAGFR